VKVVVTGAFGNLGAMVVRELVERGHDVVACDVDSPRNRRAARSLGPSVKVTLGDVRAVDLAAIAPELDAVAHLAALLPPATDRNPARAREVNVDATLRLVAWVEAHRPEAAFVFPSSLTVYGPPTDWHRRYGPDDPTRATDEYTRGKLEVEARLRASSCSWSILRVGVSVDARTLSTDVGTLRRLLSVHPDHPLHWIHPRDVAAAIAAAMERPAARRRVLCLGGDASTRVTHHAFLSAAVEATGLALPRRLLGRASYPTCWLDTTESDRWLGPAARSFSVYRDELAARLADARSVIAPLFRAFAE
jgi:nucleoside-diphosphate-sugar epimerase